METIDISHMVPRLDNQGEIILPAMVIDNNTANDMIVFVAELSKSAFAAGNHVDAISLAVVRAILTVMCVRMTMENSIIEVTETVASDAIN